METGARRTIALGAIFALLAVVMGAVGSHALKPGGAFDAAAVYRTAVEYHLFSALGLLIIGVLRRHEPSSNRLKVAAWLMALGIVFFCGSLYLLALTGERFFTMITPVGGICLMASWAMVALAMWKR